MSKNKPITRTEIFWAKTAGESVVLPKPETRKELFLAKAAGEDVTVPTPITREEMFINNVKGGGTDVEQVYATINNTDFGG